MSRAHAPIHCINFEGSHALIGADFVRRYGETAIVVNAVAAHHAEVKPETIYAGLVILAGAISASRPGAALKPRSLTIIARWKARGGFSSVVTAEWSAKKKR